MFDGPQHPGPGRKLSQSESWINRFRDEWMRLAKGDADDKEVVEAALALYPTYGQQDAAEVVREFYGPA
jgi:hypothetical protein